MDQSLPQSSSSRGDPASRGYIDWSAAFAGALIAASLSFVLITFGAAAGLFSVSPWPNSGVPARAAVWLGIMYVVAQQIGAFMAGGYVAGRMRPRWNDASEDEVDFRDGLHGGLVWALGIAIGAILAFSAAGVTARSGASLAAPAASAIAERGTDVVLDALMRPAPGNAQGPGVANPAPAAPGQTPAPGNATQLRAEIGRIIASAAASGTLSQENKTYVAQIVARQTGISPQEAEARVDRAVNATLDAADRARRATMLVALVSGVSIMVSFAASWWGALRGGHHRDNAVAARFSFAPRRPRTTSSVR